VKWTCIIGNNYCNTFLYKTAAIFCINTSISFIFPEWLEEAPQIFLRVNVLLKWLAYWSHCLSQVWVINPFVVFYKIYERKKEIFSFGPNNTHIYVYYYYYDYLFCFCFSLINEEISYKKCGQSRRNYFLFYWYGCVWVCVCLRVCLSVSVYMCAHVCVCK
jgi:hypothetical protein